MSTTQTTSPTDTQPKAGAVPVRAPKKERPCSCAGGGAECETCKKKAEEPILQRKAAGPARAATAPPSVNRVLDSPGRPLDAPARSFMEPRFGRDFGGVRVHTDPAAAESARAVDAHAYTVGQHIVFDSGKYDPHSGPGRNLLAHELAHTVQQRGAGPAPSVLRLGETPEYNHLESEASRVAQSVVHHPGATSVPRSAGVASRPILSRAKKDSPTATSPKEEDANDNLKKVGVEKYTLQDDTVLAKMSEAFLVPANKGDVIGNWDTWAGAGKLKATYDWVAGKNANPRGSDPDKRALWLKKVHWDADPDPGAKWKAAGGDTASFNPPKAGGKTCQVDHIVELQIGGENEPDNMQMLDSRPNASSGGKIRGQISQKAEEIKAALNKEPKIKTSARNVEITYRKVAKGAVDPEAPQPGKCYDVEKSVSGTGAPAAKETGGIEFPILAGSSAASMFAATAAEAIVKLEDSADTRNKTVATLIPGLSLTKWQRTNPKNPNDGGTVHAHLDPKNEGKGKPTLPAALFSEVKGEISMQRTAKDGSLKLAGGPKGLKAIFKYLSPVDFTSLKLEDDGTLSGAGKITPKKLLPPFEIVFNKDEFKAVKAIPPEKLQKLVPIPGVKILSSDLMLQIAPVFAPSGEIGFSLDVAKRHLLNGQIKASADEQGLVLGGAVQVSLPGVDNADGKIQYQGGQWSGSAEIKTTQLKEKFKQIKSGEVSVVFSDKGMSGAGKVMLDLPLTDGVEAELGYADSKWSFKGTGKFKIPGIKEADVNINYDGEHLTGGTGPQGIQFELVKGVDGTLHLHYNNGKFSGSGKLTVHKGKAQGWIQVDMHEGKDAPTFSGKGEVTYPLTKDLIATGGIEINERGKIRLSGALEFPKPIPLFAAKHGEYKFFEIGINIPIPGASIPGLGGVEARIDGSLSAGYALGPGELRNTKIEAAFDPLEEKPDAEIAMTSTLYIGGNVHISGRIAGSIRLDAFVASVGGGIALTLTASLDGALTSQMKLQYAKSRFTADLDFNMLAGLALTLALDAFVNAEAGWGPLKVSTEYDWKLASYTYDTGAKFGMKLKNPIHYASDEPIKLPSFDDIEWVVPKIDPGDMMHKVFSGTGPSSKEKQ